MPAVKPEKYYVRLEVKKLEKKIQRFSRTIKELERQFGENHLTSRDARAKQAQNMANYSELKWKLSQLALGELKRKLELAHNKKTRNYFKNKIKLIEANQTHYTQIFEHMNQLLSNWEKVRAKITKKRNK